MGSEDFVAIHWHCSCSVFFLFAFLFPVPSASDILVVLFSSYFILISLADA